MKIKKEAAKLQAKEITVEQFIRATLHDWSNIAKSLLRRWRAPVEVEDVVQDLCCAVVQFVPLFDATRGVTLGDFLIYNATDKAKKRIHCYREANEHRFADSNASRVAVSCDPTTTKWCSSQVYAPTQEDRVALRRLAQRMPTAGGQLVAVAIIDSQGDLEATSESVFLTAELRAKFRLNTLADARRLTRAIFGVMKQQAAISFAA